MVRRIATVIDPWSHPFNGTVVSTRRFVFALEAAGCEVNLLAIGSDAGGPPAGARERVPFERLSIPGVNRLIDSMRAPLARPDRARIRDVLRGCDLLHVQFPFFLGRAAIREARALGIPVVCSFHVQPENILQNLGLSSRRLQRLLYRLFVWAFYQRADHVIAPSEFAAELLREHGVRRPIAVVSNGVPADFFEIPPHRCGSDADPLRVLSVGRLAREKQQETLLRAVAESRHRDRIELCLAGTGPRAGALEALARTLGLRVRIGPVDDDVLLECYARSDLFVHCGAIELEGMAVLEAMASGNVVIVSDSRESACGRFVTNERARFRCGDASDLTEKIDYWLDHRDQRLLQGAANRQYAFGLSHQRSVARLLALYDEVLERSGAAACGRANGSGPS